MCLGWIVLAFVLALCCAGSRPALGYYFPPGAAPEGAEH